MADGMEVRIVTCAVVYVVSPGAGGTSRVCVS
jgi:hypothetical protein